MEEPPMAWRKPRVIEISVAMEINCYACAEV
jgi:coenzyme PQQ precursor peptide PqqA